MAWKDNHPFSLRRLAKSFTYAFQGILYAIKNEKNFQIHVLAALAVMVCGILLQLNKIEWLFIIICIFGMFSLELMNTAIERAVDHHSKEISPVAKQAKDLAAGAVLVYALMSIVIGSVIFLPKFAALF
ncbi:diacylglycerol kinase family protein [Siminovitchia sediminis]|uniref:Diacylglycerol kinase family protein n=1 Tax=Siminovitchia sediminis TaxID=1274353 RepID=A0ABW4KC90_9BACI